MDWSKVVTIVCAANFSQMAKVENLVLFWCLVDLFTLLH